MSFYEDTTLPAQRRRKARLGADVERTARDISKLAIDAQATIAGQAELRAAPGQTHIALQTPAEYQDLIGQALVALLETERARGDADKIPEANIELPSADGASPVLAARARALAVVARAIGSYKRQFPQDWLAGGSLDNGKALAELGSRGDAEHLHNRGVAAVITKPVVHELSFALLQAAVLVSPSPSAAAAQDFLDRLEQRLEAALADARSDASRKHTQRKLDELHQISKRPRGGQSIVERLHDVPLHPMTQSSRRLATPMGSG